MNEKVHEARPRLLMQFLRSVPSLIEFKHIKLFIAGGEGREIVVLELEFTDTVQVQLTAVEM